MEEKNRAIPAIIIKLLTLWECLSRSEHKVIDYIVKESDKVIYLSGAEFAQNCGVSVRR